MDNTSEVRPESPSEVQHATVRIIVNAQPKEVPEGEISYEQVVDLAFDNDPPKGPNVLITVTYQKGVDGAEGSLLPDHSVRVVRDMTFYVKATDKS
jgi:hypothetical protein